MQRLCLGRNPDRVCCSPSRRWAKAVFDDDVRSLQSVAPNTRQCAGIATAGHSKKYNIAVLPEGLSLGGDLYLDSTKINALPEGLSVGGGLYLRGTKITELPEGLSVGGELYLDGTDITELPKRLRVGGNLDLSGTKITELPRVPAFAPLADFRHRQRRLDRRHRRYRGSRKASVSWSLARL